MARRTGLGPVAALAMVLAAVCGLVLVLIGLAAPSGVDPLFTLAPGLLGAGDFALFLAGVIVGMASSGTPSPDPMAQWSQRQENAGARRGALAAWICVIVLDALGLSLLFAVQNTTGYVTVGVGSVAWMVLVAVVTIGYGGFMSFFARARLARG